MQGSSVTRPRVHRYPGNDLSAGNDGDMHPSFGQAAGPARTVLNRRRHLSAARRRSASILLDYWDLAKPEIAFLVSVSALAGFLLGSPFGVDGFVLVAALAGIGGAAAGSGALNHVIERRTDALMRRTATRPLPAGRINPVIATIIGCFLLLAGIAVLAVAVNGITAVLAGATAFTYLLVYTPLKHRTKFNTLAGCIPGALPALGGWTAATGRIGTGGLALFAVLFIWQIPHFLSLAWMYRKDYARARFAMLPVVEPDGKSTASQMFAATLSLPAVSLAPAFLGLAGWPYVTGAILLGLGFNWPTYRFLTDKSNRRARSILLASIIYIPALVLIIVLDRFL